MADLMTGVRRTPKDPGVQDDSETSRKRRGRSPCDDAIVTTRMGLLLELVGFGKWRRDVTAAE
ncbi:MAG: hypothetical protein ABI832_18750 [bacterium]